MPADEAPKGAEAVALAINEHWLEIGLDAAVTRDEMQEALRADPLRAYIREQMAEVPCPRCNGTTRATAGIRCPDCEDGTLPRYRAEGGTEAFIEGLRGRV